MLLIKKNIKLTLLILRNDVFSRYAEREREREGEREREKKWSTRDSKESYRKM